jgi:outer membrane protein assembly factor BamB
VLTVSAIKETEERALLCLDRRNGTILWQQPVVKSPMERVHTENSHASSTPACDGERVFCSFLDGHEVLVAAYDLEGKLLWQKRPGTFSSVHGFCSTPIVYRDTIVVNCDHDGDGYIVALRRKDGTEHWRIDRPNKTRSYCAPLIRTIDGKDQMVLSGSKCVTAYDPASGKLLWIIDGPTDQFVASPYITTKLVCSSSREDFQITIFSRYARAELETSRIQIGSPGDPRGESHMSPRRSPQGTVSSLRTTGDLPTAWMRRRE